MTSKNKAGAELEIVLGCGAYQVFQFIIYQFVVFLSSANMAFMSFGKVVPQKWTCEWEENGNFSMENFSIFNDSMKWNKSEQCQILLNGSCNNFYYETDFTSVVTEVKMIFLNFDCFTLGRQTY